MLNIPEVVKALFRTDSVRKNFRVHFPDGEYRDLVNSDIVADSVKFTESVCSKTVLQFGLAEASRIEFECVGVPNIYGATIECYCEIDASTLDAEYQTVKSDVDYPVYVIPYGVFRVQSCPRSAGAMSHRRVEAYALDAVGTSQMSNLLTLKLNSPSVNPTMVQNIPLLLAGEYNDISDLSVTESTISMSSGTVLNMPNKAWTYNGVTYTLVGYLAPTGSYYNIRFDSSTTSKDVMFRCTCNFSVSGEDETIEELESYGAPQGVIELMKAYCRPGIEYTGGSFGRTRYAFEADTGYIYPYAPNYTTNRFVIPTTSITFRLQWGTFPNVQTIDYTITPTVTDVVLKRYDSTNVIDMTLKSTSNTNYSGTSETGDYYTYTDALDLVSLKEGMLELNAQFGQTSREGLPKKVTLSQSSPISMDTSEYSEMWWDEYSISPIGSIKYTYRDSDLNQEQTMIYSFGAGLSEYDMTSNYLLKNLSITKADAGMELYEYVQGLLDTYFIPNISDIYFTPVDLSAIGLPYLEAGDYLEIDAGDGTTVGTYILSRTLSGEQYLTDDIQSQGGEIIGSTVRSA